MRRRDFLLAAGALGLTARPALAADPVRVEVTENGLAGRYFAPPGARRRPAVLMLGGSNGGFPSDAYALDLARAGYPVLTLAYFRGFTPNAPAHLPAALEEIPLEYFFRAIDWLKARPEANPRKVVLMGESRGGELVLQLAALRRDVGGVIAYVPSHVRWGAVGPSGKGAWTLKGRTLPYLRDQYQPNRPMTQGFLDALAGPPATVEAAAIPVERIRGDVLLVSTTSDGIWPSAMMAQRVAERLDRRPRIDRRVRSLTFDNASHLLMGPGPGMTRFSQGAFTIEFGGTEEGTRIARDQAWAAVKAFLGAV